MALVLKDRVKETTTTTGTGTYTLAGAVAGFEAFSEIGNSNTTYYCCTDGTDFEVGIGTYTASGTTLARTTILQSSNSDNAVNWSSGSRTIFCTQPADKAVFLNADGDIEFDNSHRIKLTSNNSDPVLDIGGSGPNFITFRASSDFSSLTNAVQIVYRTSPNDLLIERSGTEKIAEFGGDDGHAALYFNDSKKLETVSGGITVTGEVAATSLDISGDVDVDGTLEADAMTLNGTAITTTATLSTGISNNNVPKFTSGVADNDFLRVDGTAIEGRSASEVLSDIAAMPLAGGTFTGNVTLQNAGDVTLTLEADTDNVTETDNPSLVLSQDGGSTVSNFSLNSSNRTVIQAHTNGALVLQNSDGDLYLKATNNDAVDLYFNNSKKLETTNGGISVTGEVAATSLDISGDVDVDGTLEADAITLNGTSLAASATTDTTNASNIGSGTLPNARLDQQLQDVAGLAVTNGNFIVGDGSNFVAESGATARASLGLGTAATSATGDFATAAQGSTADAAMPKAGGTFTGDVTFTGANYNIVFDKSDDALEFADNAKAKFGAGGDLQIYHSGSGSFISDVGTGNLRIGGSAVTIENSSFNETMMLATQNGAVELYHDNVKKLETTADGVEISSTDDGAGNEPILSLYRHSGSPADADHAGTIQFNFQNDADEKTLGGRIYLEVDDVSDGTEDAAIKIAGLRGGSEEEYLELSFGLVRILSDSLYLPSGKTILFEGTSNDTAETTLTVADPSEDRTITLPDATGTVLLTDGSGASLTSLNASQLSSGTVPNARLDAQLQDVAGLAVTNGGFIVGDGSNFVLETGATARTSLGLGSSATADTGISNGNVAVFTSGAADNDFLRIDGTSIEGRSASEVLSDIGAQASLTFGISNTNAVKIDSSSVADDEFARFTANGLESRSASEVRSDIGLGTAAVAATGISNGNVPVFTSGVADNDFLRVNGTSIEGRSASELASDIGASTTDEATALAIALG